MYVTYSDLIQIGIFIVALIGLIYEIFNIKNLSFLLDKIKRIILRAINAYFVHRECKFIFLYAIIFQIMCIYIEICSLVEGELQLYEEN